MTSDKAHKTAIRQRMAETGEPYSEARRRLADPASGREPGPDRTTPADQPSAAVSGEPELAAGEPRADETVDERYAREAQEAGVDQAQLQARSDELQQASDRAREQADRAEEAAELAQERADQAQEWADEARDLLGDDLDDDADHGEHGDRDRRGKRDGRGKRDDCGDRDQDAPDDWLGSVLGPWLEQFRTGLGRPPRPPRLPRIPRPPSIF